MIWKVIGFAHDPTSNKIIFLSPDFISSSHVHYGIDSWFISTLVRNIEN